MRKFPFRKGDKVIYCDDIPSYMSITGRWLGKGNQGKVLAVREGVALVKFKGFSWPKQVTNTQIRIEGGD
ncbi:MAG: hypothetical protein ACXAEN_20275 [Candidatus Thorarchaeota archaeon]|jgi:hypothetical protein